MRRSLLTRCFGTLLALWFAISIAEPQWLHACPMHAGGAAAGGHGATPAAGAPAAAAHGGHGAHASHASSPTDAAPDATPAGGSHSAAHCLCIGDCSPGGAVTVPMAPEAPVATIAVIEARGTLAPAAYVPIVRARTLPFATAPPVL